MATKDGAFQAKERLYFDEGGVIGSKHHNSKIERSVLISSTLTYNKVATHKIDIYPGALGENILLEGIELSSLMPYDKIAIADVILEITQNCTLCRGLSQIDSRLPKLLQHDRGIFAKVIQGGSVAVGDSYTLLK